MTYTLIWYDKQGVLEKTEFDTEKVARDHLLGAFEERKLRNGVVAAEVRKGDGTVVFSQAGGN